MIVISAPYIFPTGFIKGCSLHSRVIKGSFQAFLPDSEPERKNPDGLEEDSPSVPFKRFLGRLLLKSFLVHLRNNFRFRGNPNTEASSLFN